MPLPVARYGEGDYGASVYAGALADEAGLAPRAVRGEAARRAFPRAQLLLASPVAAPLSAAVSVGWYSAAVGDQGSLAVARRGGAYEGYVGEVLRFEVEDRAVFALVDGVAEVDEDLSLARRAFFDLDLLARKTAVASVSLCE
jgi:hypothetical protein